MVEALSPLVSFLGVLVLFRSDRGGRDDSHALTDSRGEKKTKSDGRVLKLRQPRIGKIITKRRYKGWKEENLLLLEGKPWKVVYKVAATRSERRGKGLGWRRENWKGIPPKSREADDWKTGRDAVRRPHLTAGRYHRPPPSTTHRRTPLHRAANWGESGAPARDFIGGSAFRGG